MWNVLYVYLAIDNNLHINKPIIINIYLPQCRIQRSLH